MRGRRRRRGRYGLHRCAIIIRGTFHRWIRMDNSDPVITCPIQNRCQRKTGKRGNVIENATGTCRENRGMELRFIIPTLAHAAFTIHYIFCCEDYRSVGFERLIVLSVVWRKQRSRAILSMRARRANNRVFPRRLIIR